MASVMHVLPMPENAPRCVACPVIYAPTLDPLAGRARFRTLM
jgi:hypothetical protein